MLSVYYVIFYSQILYGSLVWALTTLKNINVVNTLQKKCIRIINMAPYHFHTNDLFYHNKILKLNDIILIEQLELAFRYVHNILPTEVLHLFQSNTNRYNTRNMEM